MKQNALKVERFAMKGNIGLDLIGSRPAQVQRQRGAVLLVSVVTLSLLALAGLSTFEQTVVQERGAVNGQATDHASRNAEEGLKQAVKDLVSGDLFSFDGCSLELEEGQTQSDWACEVVSDGDGYTYVVSYFMEGDQPAQDEDGNTIYEISVNGVQGGGNSGSLASQKLTAGVSVSTVESAGPWDAVIVGCGAVQLNTGQSNKRIVVNGDIINTNANASMHFMDYNTVNGDVTYTDTLINNSWTAELNGEVALGAASACNPLSIDSIFDPVLAAYDSVGADQGEYTNSQSNKCDFKDTVKTYSSFTCSNADLEVEGDVTLYVKGDFELNNAPLKVKGNDSVLKVYAGSVNGEAYDGNVIITNDSEEQWDLKGSVSFYTANDFSLENTKLQFQGPNPTLAVYAGSPDGDGFSGDIKIKNTYFNGQGVGRAVEHGIEIYGLFGKSYDDNKCDNDYKDDDYIYIDSDWSTNSTNLMGGRVYAPRSTVCIGTDFRGAVRGYDVWIEDSDTEINYSVPEELQGDFVSSEAKDYTLFFYTKADVDFVAGGEALCDQGQNIDSSDSSSGAGVDCAALSSSSSDDDVEEPADEGAECTPMQNNKVLICHKQGMNFSELEVNQNALGGHLGHGDYCGPCN